MISRRRLLRVSFAAAFVAATLPAARAAAAQDPALLTIHVHVADSSGMPIAGVDLSILRSVGQTIAHAATDAFGNQTFSIARTGHDAELVARKIGFRRVDRFFSDTVRALTLALVLPAAVRTLETVNVTATENVTRKSYFIDADEIDRSPRPIIDALDVVMKLKPDMIWGRRGKPDKIDQHVTGGGAKVRSRPADVVKAAEKYGYCVPVQWVWVNGQQIRDVAIDPLATLRRSGDAQYINIELATVLASIKPEHIASMEYHDCTDFGADKPVGSNNAIFVTLKDGIGFSPGVGSYVAAIATVAAAATVPTAATAAAPAQRALATSKFSFRILGVFDEDTGQPVPNAEVIDVATGTVARTTTTGTIALSFLPPGESQIRIQKDGYAPMTTTVVLSPADTTGITLLLAPRKAGPPTR